jgi:hypothetical protein
MFKTFFDAKSLHAETILNWYGGSNIYLQNELQFIMQVSYLINSHKEIEEVNH